MNEKTFEDIREEYKTKKTHKLIEEIEYLTKKVNCAFFDEFFSLMFSPKKDKIEMTDFFLEKRNILIDILNNRMSRN